MSESPEPSSTSCSKSIDIPTLVLPQDRYAKAGVKDSVESKSINKFNRYNNSDKSESESEYDCESTSSCESPKKLEKTNSLEALMQELENEIHGEIKTKGKSPDKTMKGKKRKRRDSLIVVNDRSDVKKEKEIPVKTCDDDKQIDEILPEQMVEHIVKKSKSRSPSPPYRSETNVTSSPTTKDIENSYMPQKIIKEPMVLKSRSRSPTVLKKSLPYRNNFNTYRNKIPHNVPFMYKGGTFEQQPFAHNQRIPFEGHMRFGQSHPFGPPLQVPHVPIDMHNIIILPPYEKPVSPLRIKADDVLNITRAPLSPRSAAFVLQNREIIERRKKSPRRSYSRSLSPPVRYRRSKSPRDYDRSTPPLRLKSPFKYINRSRSPSPNRGKYSPKPQKVLDLNKKGDFNAPKERSRSPRKDKYLSPSRDKKFPVLKDKHIASPSRFRKSSPYREKRLSPVPDKSIRLSSDKKPMSFNQKSPERSLKRSRPTSPKGAVKERLGSKLNFEENAEQSTSSFRDEEKLRKKIKRSASPVDEREHSVCDLDPVLEARKKKFEIKEITSKEGIIRLKPKCETIEKPSDDANTGEAAVAEVPEMNKVVSTVTPDDDLDTLSAFVEDTFSDEVSDGEYEGRFKSITSGLNERNVSVIPFSSLLIGSSVKVENSVKERKSKSSKRERKSRRRSKSKSPSREKYDDKLKTVDMTIKTSENKSTKGSKEKYLKMKSFAHREKIPVTVPIENKKIEIKIRNPSKYETTSKCDVSSKHEVKPSSKSTVKKDDVLPRERSVDSESDVEPEIIVDNEEDTDDVDHKLQSVVHRPENLIHKTEGKQLFSRFPMTVW